MALLLLLRWKILHNAQMLLTLASNISVQGQQAAQHRSSGVSLKERARDLHELISLSNILCGKLINLSGTGPIPLPPSQMRKKQEVLLFLRELFLSVVQDSLSQQRENYIMTSHPSLSET